MLWTSHVLLCCGIICCVAMAESVEYHRALPGKLAGGGGRGVRGGANRDASFSRDVLEEEVRARGSDPRRPAVSFLLNLYRKLEQDEVEGTDQRFPAAPGKVIRALTPTKRKDLSSHPGLTLSFNQTDIGGRPEYVELRLQQSASGTARGQRPEFSGQQLLVRVVGRLGEQVEQLHQARWFIDEEDGSIFTNLTKYVQDLLTAAQQQQQQGSSTVDLHSGSLEICIQGQKSQIHPHHHQRNIGSRVHGLRTEDFLLVVISGEKPVTWEEKLSLTAKRRRKNQHRQDYDRHANQTSLRARRRAKKGRCAMTDMYVDFHTLGWSDDIIYPITYNARTCLGRCPSPVDHSLHPTNHAILQSMMRMHDRKLKRPCCVPVTLKPLMMLHNSTADGSSHVEIRTHPDMVVGECGCR